MASFLQNLINNAANSMSEGIKRRVEDGTFNRMASDFGRDINSLGAGMVSIVSMAENAFGKLKGKVADAKTKHEERAAERQQAEEQRRQQDEQERSARLAQLEQEQTERQTTDDEDDGEWELGITPTDEFMERLGKAYEVEDEDLRLFCVARLTAQTALFFANCDGDYTDKERDCVENFKEMIFQNINNLGEGGWDAVDSIFDEINRPYTIDDIITMTHRLVDSMDKDDRMSYLESIDYLASQIVEADVREDTNTEDCYEQWRREFDF